MPLKKIADRVDQLRSLTRGRFGVVVDAVLLVSMLVGFFVNPMIVVRLNAIERQLEQLAVIHINVAALCQSTPDAHCVESLDAHARVEVPRNDHLQSRAGR